jgi:hypothetical protein
VTQQVSVAGDRKPAKLALTSTDRAKVPAVRVESNRQPNPGQPPGAPTSGDRGRPPLRDVVGTAILKRDRGPSVSATPGRSAVTADRGVTAANPLRDLTLATVPTFGRSRGNAGWGCGLGIGCVHEV